MKNRIWIIPLSVMIFFVTMALPVFAEQSDGLLSITTNETRPVSVDRLLYAAAKEIGWQASFLVTGTYEGYELANSGEQDGVISVLPELESQYANLRKVPSPLEDTNIYAFVRSDNTERFNSWDDLAGHTVGVLSQRSYIIGHVPESAEVKTEDTIKTLLDGLRSGNVQVVIFTQREHESLALPDDVIYAGLLETLTEYLYLNVKHARLIQPLSAELNTMAADGRSQQILSDIPIPELHSKKTILRILSSSEDIEREDQLETRLREQFRDDDSIEWYTVSLNVSRFSVDANMLAYYAQLIRQISVSQNIAAITVSGYEAFDFVLERYLLFFRNVPVLYYGVDREYTADLPEYAHLFTGILEEPAVYETAEAALRLFPNTKKLFILNDYMAEGRHYREAAQRQLAALNAAVEVEYSADESSEDLLNRVNALPADSIVLVGSYFRDSTGQYFTQGELWRDLQDVCDVPAFTLYSTGLRDGAFGGKCSDYERYGEALAELLRRVLGGETDLAAVAPGTYSRWVFDKKQTDRWGISERDLPAGSQLLNKPPSIRDMDRRLVYSLFMLILTVIAIIVVVSRYNLQRERIRAMQELLGKEEKIMEVKDRLERTINTAPVAYFMSINNKVVEANEYTSRQIGIHIGDDALQFYNDPAQRETLLLHAEREPVMDRIIRYIMPDGATHRFLSNIISVEYEQQRAFVLWAMDIEERESQRDQLRVAQASLQTVLDTLPTPVRITDIETAVVLYANQACLKLFGCDTPEQMFGRPLAEFLPDMQSDGKSSIGRITDEVFMAESSAVDMVYHTRTGHAFDALLVTRLIDYNGRRGMIALINDLTAEREYQQRLLAAAEKEREANQLKGTFLVNMSHEIRTPMNAIIGLTEIELRKKLSREAKAVHQKINASAKNLLQIINDILDLSKIEADKIELFNDEFELEEVIGSALLMASSRLEGKNVALVLELSTDMPRAVVGDRTRTWQILKNFLDNSAKFTTAGEIVLSVSRVEPKDAEDASVVWLRFVVSDTGVGVSDAQIKRIFLPYEQVYNETQKRYTGTGLGMPISKRLCELMGGELEITSTPGKGTEIAFSIPYARAGDERLIEAGRLAGKRVLLSGGSDRARKAIEDMLACCGAVCVVAERTNSRAADGNGLSEENKKAFDLVLVDYADGPLPANNPRQAIPAMPGVPLLLLSTGQHAPEGLSGHEILEKPFTPSQLIGRINEMLIGRRQEPEATPVSYTVFRDVNILLCEDNLINQEVAAGMLEQFGIEPTLADDGRQGLELLRSGRTFDLVFMDLHMPVMNGYEAAREIRADSRFDGVPIISLTADAMTEISEKCLRVGMNDYIAKPIAFESLHSALLKWLPADKRVGWAPDEQIES